MVTDDFFTQGIDLHSWDIIVAALRPPIRGGRDILKKELQQATWARLREREFDRLVMPSTIYIGLLLDACKDAIYKSVGRHTMKVSSTNIGEHSSLRVNGVAIYNLQDLSDVLKQESRYNDYRAIITLIGDNAAAFTKSCSLVEALSEKSVDKVMAENCLSEATLGELGLDGLPIAGLNHNIAKAVAGASLIGDFIKAHAKDEYKNHAIHIENEEAAILLSMADEDGYIPIERFEDVLKMVNHSME